MSSKTKKKLAGVVRFVILTFFFLLVVLPIYWIVITSLKTHSEIVNAQAVTYYPHILTFQNYIDLFEQLNYGQFLTNSCIVSVTSALIVVILSLFGGYALARYEFRGKNTMVLFVLITQMVPSLLVIIPLYLFFAKMKLINSYLGLFIYYVIINLPFCVITMRSFFERIPYSLEESAWIDGCGRLQGIFHIILPAMLPAIVAVFAFAFIGAWNELIGATIFLNTKDM